MGLCLPTSHRQKNTSEIAYFVYAALPPDGYESLITALGFTGIPFPDLRADIRIANLLVCPERVGWWVKERAVEEGCKEWRESGGSGTLWRDGNRSLICPDNLEPRQRLNQTLSIKLI